MRSTWAADTSSWEKRALYRLCDWMTDDDEIMIQDDDGYKYSIHNENEKMQS